VRLSLGSGAEFFLRFVRQRGMFALVLLAAIAVFAAPKVETTGPCTEAAVPDSVKKVLAPSGYRVTLDDGLTASLWPAAQILTSSKARVDATYALAPSTFFGVIIFAKNTRDCRGNAISAGAYNLRYELYPSDGAHLGVTPTPDFLLLVPAAADVNPGQSYSFEQVVGLSKQVTGKNHPAPMNLAPADATQFPSIVTDPEEHTILYIKVKMQSGELPIGLVVRAPTPE
jgi:hypothetical protein